MNPRNGPITAGNDFLKPIFGQGGALPCKPGDHDPGKSKPLPPYRGINLEIWPCGEVIAACAPQDWWANVKMAHGFIDMWTGNARRLKSMMPRDGWPVGDGRRTSPAHPKVANPAGTVEPNPKESV